MSGPVIMMSQESLVRLHAIGEATLDQLLAFVETYAAADTPKLERDHSVGRELGMAVFLAAVGDAKVNTLSLIAGFAQAVGECWAQQPPETAQAIVEALNAGFASGQSFGAEAFPPAGNA